MKKLHSLTDLARKWLLVAVLGMSVANQVVDLLSKIVNYRLRFAKVA